MEGPPTSALASRLGWDDRLNLHALVLVQVRQMTRVAEAAQRSRPRLSAGLRNIGRCQAKEGFARY